MDYIPGKYFDMPYGSQVAGGAVMPSTPIGSPRQIDKLLEQANKILPNKQISTSFQLIHGIIQVSGVAKSITTRPIEIAFLDKPSFQLTNKILLTLKENNPLIDNIVAGELQDFTQALDTKAVPNNPNTKYGSILRCMIDADTYGIGIAVICVNKDRDNLEDPISRSIIPTIKELAKSVLGGDLYFLNISPHLNLRYDVSGPLGLMQGYPYIKSSGIQDKSVNSNKKYSQKDDKAFSVDGNFVWLYIDGIAKKIHISRVVVEKCGNSATPNTRFSFGAGESSITQLISSFLQLEQISQQLEALTRLAGIIQLQNNSDLRNMKHQFGDMSGVYSASNLIAESLDPELINKKVAELQDILTNAEIGELKVVNCGNNFSLTTIEGVEKASTFLRELGDAIRKKIITEAGIPEDFVSAETNPGLGDGSTVKDRENRYISIVRRRVLHIFNRCVSYLAANELYDNIVDKKNGISDETAEAIGNISCFNFVSCSFPVNQPNSVKEQHESVQAHSVLIDQCIKVGDLDNARKIIAVSMQSSLGIEPEEAKTKAESKSEDKQAKTNKSNVAKQRNE